jgi:hypothetical protein
MYYIGPDAAKRVDPDNVDGLVTNDQFTQYKLWLFKTYPRFISCEDWAADERLAHWDPSAKLIMENMIQMGDDFDVSRADLIREYNALGIQNAHLHKPNQASEENAGLDAISTSHNLRNVVVTSHRGTRSPQETYTADTAIGAGTFGAKWTLWGPGRSALIARMTQANELYNKVLGSKVPYQGELVLDPNGPYKDYGWAKRVRSEIEKSKREIAIAKELNVNVRELRNFESTDRILYNTTGGKTFSAYLNEITVLKVASPAKNNQALIISTEFFKAGGVKSALEEIAKFNNLAMIVLCGQDADNFKVLLGNKNIITAATMAEALEKIVESNILPEDMVLLRLPGQASDNAVNKNIKQIVAGQFSTLALAKAVKELKNNPEVDAAFEKFLGQLKTDKVISEKAYEDNRAQLLEKLAEGQVLEFSADLKPAPKATGEIDAAAEQAKQKEYEEFLVKISG